MEVLILIALIIIMGAISNITKFNQVKRNAEKTYLERMRKAKHRETLDFNVRYPTTPDNFELTYAEYLKTPKWFAKKQERLEIDNFTCQQCKVPVTYHTSNCHHITYKTIFNENVHRHLVTVCHDCHSKIHEHHGKNAGNYPLL